MYNQAKLLSNNNYKVGIISSGLHSVNHFFKKKEYERFEKDNDLIIYRNYIQHFFINRYTPFEYLKGVHWKLCNQLFKKYIKNFDDLKIQDNLNTAIIIPDKDIIPGAETLSPAYIIFENYEKILNWNRSLRFALAVCTLKERFKNEI